MPGYFLLGETILESHLAHLAHLPLDCPSLASSLFARLFLEQPVYQDKLLRRRAYSLVIQLTSHLETPALLSQMQ